MAKYCETVQISLMVEIPSALWSSTEENSNNRRHSGLCPLDNCTGKQGIPRLWVVGDCVTVSHMPSRLCVDVHVNMHAYVYMCVCDIPSRILRIVIGGIWGEEMTLLCLHMHCYICLYECVLACVCERHRVGVTN